MKPYRGNVWRKGNRRASRGVPHPHREVYWPVCGSPAPEFLESRETPTGGVEFVWRCRSCGTTWTRTHWVPIARMAGHRHHVQETSSKG